jgi:hypothetical protein
MLACLISGQLREMVAEQGKIRAAAKMTTDLSTEDGDAFALASAASFGQAIEIRLERDEHA